MNKIELKARHAAELREFTDECVNGVIEMLPIRTEDGNYNVTTAMTIDECYELSNKFLSKKSLEYYLKCHKNVHVTIRECVRYFIKCDENGRPFRNANIQTDIRYKTGYMRLIYHDNDTWYEEEED